MKQHEALELPVTIDVPTAGQALGIGRTTAYALARAGEFPIPVLTVGRRLRVCRADLLGVLGISNTPSMPMHSENVLT